MADAWNADRYEANARFVSDLGQGVLDWLAPQPGERILDLGCGDGALTEKLVSAGANVVGVDASPDMIAGAKARGIDAHIVDGHALAFSSEFDAVFSNAALHWMKQPDAVISGVAKALKPGGRFVAEFGGHGNVAAIRTALSSVIEARTGIKSAPDAIWYFPSAAEHKALLEAAGFLVQKIALIPRPTPIPSDMGAWMETLAAPVLASVKDETLRTMRLRFEARL